MVTPKAPPKEPVTCARPGCANQFVPYRPAHVYCSARCKKTVISYGYALNRGR
jgi:hypothetical protein